jgi:RNA polymerase sigma-70 factor (ECF subfamily)
LVVSARDLSRSPASGPIAELCGQYWSPVYAYLRQRGHRRDEAEDLTQGFFAHLLAKRVLQRAEPERGRLRSLLLACLTNFVANEKHLHRAKKRSGAFPASLCPRIDPRDVIEPSDELTPDRIYERQWAVALLRRVLDQLRDEFAAGGKAQLFDALKNHLVGDTVRLDYRRAAAVLNVSEGSARVAVHRLRHRYRTLLWQQIARTVNGSTKDIEEEINYLRTVVQRQPDRESVS